MSRRSPAIRRAVVAPMLAAALLLGSTLPSAADLVPPPTQWPATPGLAPQLGANAHAVRIAGADRYETNLAAALTLRGQGGYPFGTPDRSTGWWGAGACPATVLVVAGDSTADALAAAPLSDPTDQSSEPQLRISATADPTFDGPVGAVKRVDTDRAPVLLTRSAREGAAQLSTSAQTAAFDLSQGACRADEAIVVGGPAAVPTAVDEQLIGLGYRRVFRVAGADRYGTAASVAQSLGTGPPQLSACEDPDSTDGSTRTRFAGNATVELRSGPTQCTLLPRTVVLADGQVGADALAAGWWTSLWQVPVLLTGPDGALPAATRDALAVMSLQIDNIVVLGGTARIPDASASTAGALASATVRRVAGHDRTGTSVRMAEVFGGWHATGDGADFAGSMACLAASGGNGTSTSPDALGAGPWCAAVSGAAGGPGAPGRATAPVAGPASEVLPPGGRPAHDLVPVLLVPPGASELPASVAALLAGAFDPSSSWCSGLAAAPGCTPPGFAVAFGGTAAVTPPALLEAARHLSGGSYGAAGDLAPDLDPIFATDLDMAPVFHRFAGAGDGVPQACVLRAALTDVRWFTVWDDPSATAVRAVADAVVSGRYRLDADGAARTPGTSAPSCVALAGAASPAVGGVSLSGHPSGVQVLDLDHRLSLAPAIEQSAPLTTGASSDSTAVGASTELTFATEPAPGTVLTVDGVALDVLAATLRLQLRRRTQEGAPDQFSGTATVVTEAGTYTFALAGEGIFDQQVWRLRGRSDVAARAGLAGGVGGFVADLDTGPGPGSADDEIVWDLDALLDLG